MCRLSSDLLDWVFWSGQCNARRLMKYKITDHEMDGSDSSRESVASIPIERINVK